MNDIDRSLNEIKKRIDVRTWDEKVLDVMYDYKWMSLPNVYNRLGYSSRDRTYTMQTCRTLKTLIKTGHVQRAIVPDNKGTRIYSRYIYKRTRKQYTPYNLENFYNHSGKQGLFMYYIHRLTFNWPYVYRMMLK